MVLWRILVYDIKVMKGDSTSKLLKRKNIYHTVSEGGCQIRTAVDTWINGMVRRDRDSPYLRVRNERYERHVSTRDKTSTLCLVVHFHSVKISIDKDSWYIRYRQ